MPQRYNNDGLSPEQIGYLDGLIVAHEARDGFNPTTLTAMLDQFESGIKHRLETNGIDMSDPRIYYAVLAGASLMQGFVSKADQSGRSVDDTGALIFGALVNVRPTIEM